jgi:dolichyl-phosphate beta-glucosyltransferase
MSARGCDFEILVVDDGSTDRTAETAVATATRDTRVRLLRNDRNMGKGFAVRRGVLSSRGSVVMFTDADLSTPIEEYGNLLPHLASADLVIASRSLPDSNVVLRQPAYREFMGRTFNAFVQTLIVKGIIDTQCGFKLMRREVADKIFGLARINSFSFDVEVILIARRLGYSVKDVPVTWVDSRGSRVHPIWDSGHMLLDLLRIKLYDLLGYYRQRIERE